VSQIKLNLVFKVLNGLAPDYMSCNFNLVSNLHQHNTRTSHKNIVTPQYKSSGQSTFIFTGAKL
jgi:hypothetical protein